MTERVKRPEELGGNVTGKGGKAGRIRRGRDGKGGKAGRVMRGRDGKGRKVGRVVSGRDRKGRKSRKSCEGTCTVSSFLKLFGHMAL